MDRQGFRELLEKVNAGRLNHEGDYIEIPTTLFVHKIDVNMPPLPAIDFYLPRDGQMELMRKADQPFSPLVLSSMPAVWVREADFSGLQNFAQSVLTNPSFNSGMSTEARMESLRKSAMLVVEDLFENPSKENIDKSIKVVGSFVYVLMKDPNAYLFLTKLSSHDPYTLQHSVGTAVHCIILARKMGITSEAELEEVGLAGLLHDVGKVKVRKELINKNGPLDELEWEEMRQHALEGYEIVKNHPEISERTKRAILEHHEDRNGTGYPLALRAEEVHLFSKIVCICDIFNALTTNRSYSNARPPFEAFQLMREKLSHKIDDELFQKLVLVYGGEVDAKSNAAAKRKDI